jgi:type I site-specific restriction-modification system R (restriction) subunit
MSTVGQREVRTQQHVVQRFTKELGYRYLGHWKDRVGNSHIEQAVLVAWLTQRGHSDKIIQKVLFELEQASILAAGKTLYDANREVYSLLRYGVIETPEKYYLEWKEDGTVANPLDRALGQICRKERLLEIIHDFIVFDAGTKKTCRHNQYFGVRAAAEHVRRREGGIIWHTQGSGKSLTMVWLAKWIREHVANARVPSIRPAGSSNYFRRPIWAGSARSSRHTNHRLPTSKAKRAARD